MQVSEWQVTYLDRGDSKPVMLGKTAKKEKISPPLLRNTSNVLEGISAGSYDRIKAKMKNPILT